MLKTKCELNIDNTLIICSSVLSFKTDNIWAYLRKEHNSVGWLSVVHRQLARVLFHTRLRLQVTNTELSLVL